MYNKSEVLALKAFAQTTTLHMEMLIKTIDTMEALAEDNQRLRSMTDQFAGELQATQARVQEDEATIQFKDNQLKAAASSIEALNLDITTLKQEKEMLKSNCRSYEAALTSQNHQIATLQAELDSYQPKTEIKTPRPPFAPAPVLAESDPVDAPESDPVDGDF